MPNISKVSPIFESCGKTSVPIEGLERLYDVQSHKVNTGDKILFPPYEELTLKAMNSRIIDEGGSEERYYVNVYAPVVRNGRKEFILIRKKCVYAHKAPVGLYSLTARFMYPNNNLVEMLQFLGDLEKPITVLEKGIAFNHD